VCIRGCRKDTEHKNTPTGVWVCARCVLKVKDRYQTQNHTNEVWFRARHVSKVRKRRKHPYEGVVSCQACIKGPEKILNMKTPLRGWFHAWRASEGPGNKPNTKTHQRGVWVCARRVSKVKDRYRTQNHMCDFVPGMYRRSRKDTEHKNTPTRVWFHAWREVLAAMTKLASCCILS
jgi:hypothetical protein